MKTINALQAAGQTDPGRQRTVNEDRFHCDAGRGLFIVVDGVGGQAAGGKAADVALASLRKGLDREIGSAADRVRKAITAANNEIFRMAGRRSEWSGMACVLTAAIVDNGRATIGHVGDTRLYKLRNGLIEKITRDHSPVGEREDAQELSEQQAMRHPRRNEVYRDVGSELHETMDADFVDICEIAFEADAALLLCSDGLTDLVESASISSIVMQHAGSPEIIARRLIEMANAAGGKDNVTVVYVEGERFAAAQSGRAIFSEMPQGAPGQDGRFDGKSNGRMALLAALLVVIGFVAGIVAARLPGTQGAVVPPSPPDSGIRVVQPNESIAQAIEQAAPGTQVIVEPGEYRERIVLKNGIRLVSRVPRGATIRLPGNTLDADAGPAVRAMDVSKAELTGFRIIGDSATPLAVGIGITGSEISISDVEVSGATKAGIDFGEGAALSLLASDIHHNPGAAIFVRSGANPRIVNNVFTKNGLSERAAGTIVLEAGSAPLFQGNVFVGLSPDVFTALDAAARASLKRLNWFLQIKP